MRSAPGSTALARLLVIDNDPASLRQTTDALRPNLPGTALFTVATTDRAAAQLLRDDEFDLVLADLDSLADLGDSTEDAVSRLAKIAGEALVIASLCGGSVSIAVAAMRAGAHDFVARPVNGAMFATRLAELAERHGKRRALKFDPSGFENTRPDP